MQGSVYQSITKVIFITMLLIGCNRVNIEPADYFSGQQLTLAKAIEAGDTVSVEKLAINAILNKPGNDDMTILFFALSTAINNNGDEKHLSLITQLVKAGADPMQKRAKGQASPAVTVAKADKAIWLKALLDGGLSPNAKVRDETLLFAAIKAENLDTTRLLLTAGADINAKNSLGDTP